MGVSLGIFSRTRYRQSGGMFVWNWRGLCWIFWMGPSLLENAPLQFQTNIPPLFRDRVRLKIPKETPIPYPELQLIPFSNHRPVYISESGSISKIQTRHPTTSPSSDPTQKFPGNLHGPARARNQLPIEPHSHIPATPEGNTYKGGATSKGGTSSNATAAPTTGGPTHY